MQALLVYAAERNLALRELGIVLFLAVVVQIVAIFKIPPSGEGMSWVGYGIFITRDPAADGRAYWARMFAKMNSDAAACWRGR
ncbi:hypothetical protein KIF59_10595 [Enterobacter cloacae subsp. cloacae]|nr:hypothetical protein [Enterobacter cloacae subsp. cloacae]